MPTPIEQILGAIPKRTGDRVMGMVEQIAGGLVQRDPIGGVFRGVREFRQGGQDRESLAAALAYRADQLDKMGTPQAGEMAKLLRTDPKTAHSYIMNSGGYPATFQKLEAGAAQKRAGDEYREYMATVDPSKQTSANWARWANKRGVLGPEQVYKLAADREAVQPEEEGIGPLVEVADPNSPTGTRWVTREAAVGQAGKPGSSISFKFNPDTGEMEYRSGHGETSTGEAALTRGAKTNLQQSLVDLNAQIGRLTTIEGGYKRSYLQLPEQVRQGAMEWQEYLGGKLTPEQAQSAVAYNEFRSNVMAELNETLRMLSGAAVTAHEMERLKEQLPSMNDSPTVFMATLKASRRRSARAIARLGYVRRKGLDLEGIPLYRIDKIMETRGDELKAEAQRQNPGMSDADASDIANQQIASEFGVSFDDVGL